MSYVLSQFDQTFASALLHAYNDAPELSMLLQFEMNENLDEIASSSLGLKARVAAVLKWADAEGRLDELFVKAIERKPGNPKLRQLAATLAGAIRAKHDDLAKKIEPLDNREYENPNADEIRAILRTYEGAGALEALVVNAPAVQSGQDTEKWELGLKAARKRVCSIGLGETHIGTGFLIGPDRVLTNAHVVDPAVKPTDFSAVFGYEGSAGRPALPKYAVAESLVSSQPREYDFHVLRLAQVPLGERGYFKATLRKLELRDPVCVLGHPGGKPMTFAFGVVFDRNSFFGRVAYSASTEKGASGSPVFAEDWSLVCLHHHGEKNVNNHGIPMTAIHDHLQKNGKAHLLEVVKA